MNEDGLKEFSERLIKVRQILGYNQKEFAPQINVSLSFLYQVEASRTKPGFNFFKTLIEKFNVNPKYLFTGDGEMFYEPPPTVEKPQVDYGEYSDLVDKLIKYIKVSPVVKFAVLEFFAKGTGTVLDSLTVCLSSFSNNGDDGCKRANRYWPNYAQASALTSTIGKFLYMEVLLLLYKKLDSTSMTTDKNAINIFFILQS